MKHCGSVAQIIRLAATSADDRVLPNDFLRAAAVIETGGTIAEAFLTPATIPNDLKGILDVAGPSLGAAPGWAIGCFSTANVTPANSLSAEGTPGFLPCNRGDGTSQALRWGR